MTTRQEQLRRLRRFNDHVRGTDRELAEELLSPTSGTLEGLQHLDSAPPIDAQIALETIVLRQGRPVLAVRHNQTELVFREKGDSELWEARLSKSKDVLQTAIRSVGRIEVSGHPLSWLGTGWLVAPNVLVTNRHIAAEFGVPRGESMVFRMGSDGRTMSASVDFLQEAENPSTLLFRLVRILHIEADPGPDLAFIEVEQASGGKTLAAPIKLVNRAPRLTPSVVVIGYPARDSRIPDLDLMIQTFGDVFDKKRVAPGCLTRVEATQILHDCSTLGGNSGSVVLDLDSGEAVGLHFSGRFLDTNYAVRADLVRRRLNELRHGSSSRRAPFDSSTVRRAERLIGTTSAQSAADGGALRISVPLVVTVSLGALAPGATAQPTVRVTDVVRPSLTTPDDDDDSDNAAGIAAEAVVSDYADREGYIATFLGAEYRIDLPTVLRGARDVLEFDLDGHSESVLKYSHFAVLMSRSRRMCIYSAVNIDGGQSRKTRRSAWRWDPRIPREQQIMGECYGNPPKFSRGHMTRREDPAWGTPMEAARGNEDSMHVTNTVPQMQAFNAPIWLGLEDYALQNARADEMKISVFTGPFFARKDPLLFGLQIPTSFWKIIAFVHDETGELCATGYTMKQDDQLDEREFVFGQYTSPRLNTTTQVAIHSIESRSGLRFGDLAKLDVYGAEYEGADDGESEAAWAPLASYEQIRFTR